MQTNGDRQKSVNSVGENLPIFCQFYTYLIEKQVQNLPNYP